MLNLPSRQFRLFVFRSWRWRTRTRKLAAIGTLVISIIAFPPVAARLAPPTRQFLITLDLEAVTTQTTQTVTFPLAHDSLRSCGGISDTSDTGPTRLVTLCGGGRRDEASGGGGGRLCNWGVGVLEDWGRRLLEVLLVVVLESGGVLRDGGRGYVVGGGGW